MDNFRVPRKVNRHVLKAIRYLTDTEYYQEYIPCNDIQYHVKYSMRNGNPVAHLDECIRASLRNLTKLGVLTSSKDDSCYIIRDVSDMLIKRSTTCQLKEENNMHFD